MAHSTRVVHGEGNAYPLWYSCLENAMNRGAWRSIVHGVAESNTNEDLHWLIRGVTLGLRGETWAGGKIACGNH